MSTEPRYTLRTWFDLSLPCKVDRTALLKRDGGLANFESDYELSETSLKVLLLELGLDLIFVIKKIRTEPINRGYRTRGYRHFIGVQPCLIDKWSEDGTLSLSATTLLGKALDEVRRVVREQVDASAMITLSNEQPEITHLGSGLLYGDTVIVRYDKYE